MSDIIQNKKLLYLHQRLVLYTCVFDARILIKCISRCIFHYNIFNADIHKKKVIN
jgi:hypothetical protein